MKTLFLFLISILIFANVFGHYAGNQITGYCVGVGYEEMQLKENSNVRERGRVINECVQKNNALLMEVIALEKLYYNLPEWKEINIYCQKISFEPHYLNFETLLKCMKGKLKIYIDM